ncbi:hypothetical protein E3Q23_01800 [Wallemia mellicola]|uniref:Guanosine-3',5'-bis(diphosphate) 3'-pyrophosphohydrolase MESH1 n=1 Tax=Wallemia mellicola TaxID=1708541 RepID=A0A4T0M2Y1_9BASI|nr:hypothetical protein E3Q24_02849 [Wallemia mellicola]TIB76476.1 hypothetical protein E3Q23_01800 [Wallemia mellicola]TIB88669.1 HD-domain/PDEase-like protein [Wallemia mellicola]TIB91346.1 HD-domain/PDEase-like protein [Wallemia mellicola]TIB94043.1 HD-domain/PDEase-like protein [Wallemia mellicola]
MTVEELAPIEGLNDTQGGFLRLLSAVTFASVVSYSLLQREDADKHKDQRRKDKDSTPYINHTLGVAQILAQSGHDDLETLQAAILHDTIEDTNTSLQELQHYFGNKVASIVLECTDDKGLPKAARKQAQINKAKSVSLEAKRVKLADKLYNLRDLQRSAPTNWSTSRIKEYFIWARKVTSQIEDASQGISRNLNEVYEAGRFTKDGEIHFCIDK